VAQIHAQTIDILVSEKSSLQSELSNYKSQLASKSREFHRSGSVVVCGCGVSCGVSCGVCMCVILLVYALNFHPFIHSFDSNCHAFHFLGLILVGFGLVSVVF